MSNIHNLEQTNSKTSFQKLGENILSGDARVCEKR